jgi:hypothetical protein
MVQNLPVGIFEIMQGYIKYGSTFGVGLRVCSSGMVTDLCRSKVQIFEFRGPRACHSHLCMIATERKAVCEITLSDLGVFQ